MASGSILLVGEAVIDVAGLGSSSVRIRHGGICHASRALAAIDVDYEVAYAAPSYSWNQLDETFARLGAVGMFRFAETRNAPGVIVVQHPEEASHQGYELLLRDHVQYQMANKALTHLAETECTDALVIPGNFPLTDILESVGSSHARVHIDWANSLEPLDNLSALGRRASTLILSTSSPHFLDTFEGRFTDLASAVVPEVADSVLLKENRGGSRYLREGSTPIAVAAQLRPVRHSVGVGDCFDAVFVARAMIEDPATALRRASWIAAEYAATYSESMFITEARRSLSLTKEDLAQPNGMVLPWEYRAGLSVYIAAPDFSDHDPSNIDAVENALRYHNFRPRRPIQEIGEVPDGATDAERARICDADLEILESAAAVVGVYDYDDPRTLTELGYAAAKGIPTLLYDPQRRARNLMLTGMCHCVTHTLDELILEIFRTLGSRGA